MAAGINKIDDAWYRAEVAKAERQNREHLAKYDRSFNGIMAKFADERERNNRDPGTGRQADHHASTVADLLVEAKSFPDRASALQHLLHKPSGQALLSRMHKAAEQTEKETPPMTSHTEFVQNVVKRYGIVALAKSMVQEQKSYGLDEHQFTQLATDHARRIYPNDRPDSAFSKLYQSEEAVRRACAIAKSVPFVADLSPLQVGGFAAQDEAINNTEQSEAYQQLLQIGKDRWPTASESQAFTNAISDPANAALANRALRRPSATTSYEFPR
jgi:hypothetical protein